MTRTREENAADMAYEEGHTDITAAPALSFDQFAAQVVSLQQQILAELVLIHNYMVAALKPPGAPPA